MKKFICILLMAGGILSVTAQKSTGTSDLGKNIIAVSPIQLMVINPNEVDADVCVNLSYERISSNEYFGFKIPVTFSLKNPYYYFMPILKIYPFRQGVIKYAIGPQFYFATGEIKQTYTTYDYPYQQVVSTSRERTQLGFMINNSLNFSIMQNLFMGIEAGIGVNYYDTDSDKQLNGTSYYHGNDSPFFPALQINFSMGYRF